MEIQAFVPTSNCCWLWVWERKACLATGQVCPNEVETKWVLPPGCPLRNGPIVVMPPKELVKE